MQVQARTCGHLGVGGGGPLWDEALDLQELVGFVSSDDGEAEAHGALHQDQAQEAALQLARVPRERRLVCGDTETVSAGRGGGGA